MNPIIPHFWTPEERARYGIRSMEDFSAEELARLQQKVEEWIRQRAPHPGTNWRRSSFVMRPMTATPA